MIGREGTEIALSLSKQSYQRSFSFIFLYLGYFILLPVTEPEGLSNPGEKTTLLQSEMGGLNPYSRVGFLA